MNNLTNLSLKSRLMNAIPGGGHTYSKGHDQFPSNAPALIEKAKGAYCYDLEGNKYLDWAMGNRTQILGHADDYVDNAVIRAIRNGVNFTRPSYLELELSEYLIDIWDNIEMVKFGKNGSDVVSAAIKLSRAYTQKKYVLVCQDHPFFSSSDWFIGTTPCNNGILKDDTKYIKFFKYNDFQSVEKLFLEFNDDIACIILEPIKFDKPKYNFLENLRSICNKHKSVLIFDEMISGIRFHYKGAHHLLGVIPDIVTFGKCISNGYSFSVIGGNRDILDLGGITHKSKRTFLLSQTHGAEATGLAAAKATLEYVIEHKVNEHIFKIGTLLKKQISKEITDKKLDNFFNFIGEPYCPQLVVNPNLPIQQKQILTALQFEMIENGVMFPWVSITWAHTSEDVDKTVESFKKSLSKIKTLIENGFEGIEKYGCLQPVFRAYNHCLSSECKCANPNLSCDLS